MEFVTQPMIGSDVEYFVGFKSNGALASAEGIIPGTKENPHRFAPKVSKWFATQLDNVLAEGNIPPVMAGATGSWASFVNNMQTLRSHLDAELDPHGLRTVARAAARIPEKYLQSENAKTFGCDASFNCWTLREEPVTPKPGDTLRSAGFHIHIGYKNPKDEINIALARILDVILGLAAVIEEPVSERRSVGYGRAGNFRHQPHGVEYRTLSSYWADNPGHVRWAYDAATRAIGILNGRSAAGFLREITAAADDIQGCINTDNTSAARALLSKLGQRSRNEGAPMYVPAARYFVHPDITAPQRQATAGNPWAFSGAR